MNNNPHKVLHNIYLFLGIIVACIVIWQFMVQFVVPKFQTSTISTTTGVNSPSGGGDPTNGSGQEFTQQNTVQGPAIVEWWTGDVNGNNQAINCGTFKLPSGQSFTWTHLGHFWTYASDAAVNAEWDAHVRAYQAKSVNALCTVGSPPS